VPVPTLRAIHAKPELEHVALLDLLQVVLERAIELDAFSRFQEVAAHGHAAAVELVQKAAAVALHAHPPQPIGADGLPVVLLEVADLLADLFGF
jgi:hypothetical protein